MPSEKVLEAKKAQVAETVEILKAAQTGVLVDYRGLNVEEDTELRRKLREANVKYFVIKNTLLRLAAKEVGLDALDEALHGPTAIAVSSEDAVAPAKVIADFAKENDKLEIKTGFMDGAVISLDEVNKLAATPNMDTLIAKMMGSVQSHQTSNPNSIAQKAAVEALTGPQDSVAKMHAEFDKRRKYMYERICKMPLVSTIEPMGAFYVFVDASEVLGKKYKDTVVESVAQMAEILINDYNTAVVPCADFGFEKHLRLSYAISIEQIEKGLDRIESFLNDLK